MNKLSNEEHTVWMKVMKDLIFDTEHIEETKDVGHQRDHFNTLSDNMYQLLKVSKQETPTYYNIAQWQTMVKVLIVEQGKCSEEPILWF